MISQQFKLLTFNNHSSFKLATMRKNKKKLALNKETLSLLNKQKMAAIAGGDSTPYISKTRGTIYHCPSYPNVCNQDV
jgi:hypothetical protein